MSRPSGREGRPGSSMRRVVDPSGLRPGRLTPPPSKSDALRALVLAHLLGRPPPAGLDGVLPGDVDVVRHGLSRLGEAAGEPVEVDCRDGAAPLRFLLTQAAVIPGAEVRFTGSGRLATRPHDPLLESLSETLGPAGFAWSRGTPWPLTVRGAGPAPTPRFEVSGAVSSQFASSLLLGAAALQLREGRAWEVVLTPPVTSRGYLELTSTWLRRYGWEVEGGEDRFRVVRHAAAGSGAVEAGARAVDTGAGAVDTTPAVPGDWSSLGYLLLVAWRSGGEVDGVDLEAAHPDHAILSRLEEAGLAVTIDPAARRARVTGTPSRGITASCAEAPDLAPTLAALALVLPAPSRLTEVEVLRHKESDRLEGIRRLAAAVGGGAELRGDTLVLTPAAHPPSAFRFDPEADHRMALAASVVAVLTGARLTLGEPGCVAKSFPGFFGELERVGVVCDGDRPTDRAS